MLSKVEMYLFCFVLLLYRAKEAFKNHFNSVVKHYYNKSMSLKSEHFVTRMIYIFTKSNYKYKMKHKMPCKISKRN